MIDPYLDTETGILRNLVGAKTQAELNQKEADITALRIRQLKDKPVTGNFDLKHLQALHKHIFQDIYEWAGQSRQIDMRKDTTVFLDKTLIDSSFEQVNEALKRENFLIGMPPKNFAERAGVYLGTVNIIHPFREGNGRSQRAFFSELARNAGHRIEWENITRQEMTIASIEGFKANFSLLSDLLEKNLKPLQQKENSLQQQHSQNKEKKQELKRGRKI